MADQDHDGEIDGLGVGDNVEVQAPPTKRRRKHHQNTLLPPRPKKPMSGYTTYLKNYFNTHPREPGVSSHEQLARASARWREMSDEQRQQFSDLCAPENERYRRQMDLWRRQRTALKRPASAYALFVKDFWKERTEAGQVEGGVKGMGSQCKLAWDNTTANIRDQYRQRHAVASAAYRDRINGIYENRIRVEDLVNEAVNVNNIGLPQNNANAAVAAGDAAAVPDAGANANEQEEEENEEFEDAEDNLEEGGENADGENEEDEDDAAEVAEAEPDA